MLVLSCTGVEAHQSVARGKQDRGVPVLQLPRIELSAAPQRVRQPVLPEMPRVETFRIEPASDNGRGEGLLQALRYNLERIEVAPAENYDVGLFLDQTGSIGWDVAGVYGLTTVIGFSSWGWEPSKFRVKSEGWFGEDTRYLGMDKLGHAYAGYLLSEYFTQRIAHSTGDTSGAALTGALLGMGVQTYVEVLDGFSGGHGFSFEDLAMDGIGAGFSYLRSTVPGLAEKVDFRMEYLPSGFGDGFAPVTDYSGQKYLLALKLGGFEKFEDTPLRFVEFHVGYFARGMSDEERARNEKLRREPYVAIGINLQQVVDESGADATLPGAFAGRAFEYFQMPYTYVPTSSD